MLASKQSEDVIYTLATLIYLAKSGDKQCEQAPYQTLDIVI